MTRKCKGCQLDCWGREWDPEEKKYFCIADGEYLDPESIPKDEPVPREVVQFT